MRDEFIYEPEVVFKTGGKAIGDSTITYKDEDNSAVAKANKVWNNALIFMTIRIAYATSLVFRMGSDQT